jgi:hypothetical protein
MAATRSRRSAQTGNTSDQCSGYERDKEKGPLVGGLGFLVWVERAYFAAGVAVAGAVSVEVVVVVVVVVDSVPVVAVPVVAVLVAAVPVSSTTAGAWAAGALSGAGASFFWQAVSESAVAAANPRIRTFFISLYSFFLKNAFSSRAQPKRPGGKSTRNDI